MIEEARRPRREQNRELIMVQVGLRIATVEWEMLHLA
jgi:hypothetical protein